MSDQRSGQRRVSIEYTGYVLVSTIFVVDTLQCVLFEGRKARDHSDAILLRYCCSAVPLIPTVFPDSQFKLSLCWFNGHDGRVQINVETVGCLQMYSSVITTTAHFVCTCEQVMKASSVRSFYAHSSQPLVPNLRRGCRTDTEVVDASRLVDEIYCPRSHTSSEEVQMM